MSQLKICRICICTDRKMYKYDQYHLKNYYEEVMALKVKKSEDLPQFFCWECAAILYKFHKFKERCHAGQAILQNVLRNRPMAHIDVTHWLNKEIDKNNFKSSLAIIEKSHRVKNLKEKWSDMKFELPEIQNVNLPEVDIDSDSCSLKLDYDDNSESDHDIDFKDDFIENNVNSPKNIPDKIECDKDDVCDITFDTTVIQHSSIDEPIKENKSEDQVLEKSNIDKAVLNDLTVEEEILEDIDKSIKEEETKPKRQSRSKSGFKKRKLNLKFKHNRKKENKEREGDSNKFKIEQKREKFLDSNHWKKYSLSEEDADREFKAKGVDPKYVNAPYKCSDCFKGFSKKDMMTRHMKLRHDECVGPITCKFCKMRFKLVCYLNRHIREHYTKYKCLRCDLVCSRDTTATFHEDYHNGVLRRCEHCGEEFKHSSTYYTHLRTHRSEYLCNLCGASFVSEAGVHRHKLLKHVNADNDAVDVPVEGTEIKTYCERCDIKFETGKAYDEHLIHSAMHADGVEDLAEDIPVPSNPKRRKKHFKKDYRKPTTCNKCGEHFPTQKDFIKHHLAAHPRVPIILPNERHICEICGVSLAPVSVVPHLNTHTRQNRYTCTTCGLQVYSKGSLTRHQLTHSDEKPYPCSLCEKRFKQKCSMQLHYRTFHLKEPYPKRNRKKKLSLDSGELPVMAHPRHEDDSNDHLMIIERSIEKWH